MSDSIKIVDLGLMPYREAWDLQKRLQRSLIEALNGVAPYSEQILLVEHPPVYTLGFHGNAHNLLASESALAAQGIELIRIERGGDITFHGPGQLVAYPIIELTRHGLGAKSYVHLLEQAAIDTISEYGIAGERVEDATGVWVNAGTPDEAKICAIGVKCSHGVTMHGLALNVNTDLSFFNLINPCGFTSKGVTSMREQLGRELPMTEIKRALGANLLKLINPKSNA